MTGRTADGVPLDLSVVIPALDARSTIGQQLDALLAQSWTGTWEIVVADNGSTDGTREYVAGISRRESRVRLVDASGDAGPSAARNVGVEHAAGAAIAFCDADDVVADGWLAAMGDALTRSPLVAGPLEQDELNPPPMRNVHGSGVASGRQVFADVVPFGASANLGVRRDALDSVGGFDPGLRVGEDIELCLRLARAGVELEFAPEAVVHYRNRHRVRDLFLQSVAYGQASVLLFARLAELGLLSRPRWAGARNWLWLLRSLPMLLSTERRPRWVAVAGSACGRIVGSVRHRTVYL